MPRGPSGRELERLGLVMVSNESRLALPLGVFMELGDPCVEEESAVRVCGCEAWEVSILSPANLALSASDCPDAPPTLAGTVGSAFPCNLSGFGLGVGRILGADTAPEPFDVGTDSVRTCPPLSCVVGNNSVRVCPPFDGAPRGLLPVLALLFTMMVLIFMYCSVSASTLVCSCNSLRALSG